MSVPVTDTGTQNAGDRQLMVWGIIIGGVLLVLYLLKRAGANSAASVAATAAPSNTTTPNTLTQYIPTSESFTTESLSSSGANSPISVGNTATTNNTPTTNSGVTAPGGYVTPPSTPSVPSTPPVPIQPPIPPTPTQPVTTPPTPINSNPAFNPVNKPPQLTVQTAGGWWHAPNADSSGDLHWLQRTGHNLVNGFGDYYWTKGRDAAFGGPISEEWKDNSGAQSRQDFENGHMLWYPGSDAANFDVRWVSGSGAVGGGTSPEPMNYQSYGPDVIPPMPNYDMSYSIPHYIGIHTVQPGETLQTIATHYGKNWQDLYAANRDRIHAGATGMGHPIPGGPVNNLPPGLELQVPA